MSQPDEQAAPQQVLVVEDDPDLLPLIDQGLKRAGFSTALAASGEAALAWLRDHSPAVMLLDLNLPDLQGRDIVQRLTAESRCPPFIIMTGQGDERVAMDMMKLGARDYLIKDAGFLELLPGVVKRVQEQTAAERRLAEAEEQVHLVRSVLEQGFSAVLITDAGLPDPKVVYINPACARVTGSSAAEVLGKPLSALPSLAHISQRLREGIPEGARFVDEISTFDSSQGERWGEWRVGPVKDKAGRDTHWLIIFRDVTDRKFLEKEILEISDQERRRIGQDLHDGLCQHLAGIELMSQVLQQKLARRSKTDATRAGEIAAHVREAIGQTRSLARGLSPVTLESEGLISALRELAVNTEKMFGITCRVDSSRLAVPVSPSTATQLYRIAQEAVSNAIRHGRATELLLRVEEGPQGLCLSIMDNGRGFAGSQRSPDGMGLRIMQYRAGIIGGVLAIEKNGTGGARVICRVPRPEVIWKTSR